MFRTALVLVVLVTATSAWAGGHAWQRGIWRDIHSVTASSSTLTLPVTPGVPSTTVAGVALPGVPPSYMSLPVDDVVEVVTIDGTDGIRYVAQWRRHFTSAVINDPVDYAVEGDSLIVRAIKGKDFKLRIVTRIRLQ
jgi:hypothetical protein